MLRCPFGSQRTGDVATVVLLVICCHERDLAVSLELAVDLAVQGLLTRHSLGEGSAYDAQEDVGPLLLELPKGGRCVWRASALISTPSRSGSAEQQPEHRPPVAIAASVAGLTDRYAQRRLCTPSPGQ